MIDDPDCQRDQQESMLRLSEGSTGLASINVEIVEFSNLPTCQLVHIHVDK